MSARPPAWRTVADGVSGVDGMGADVDNDDVAGRHPAHSSTGAGRRRASGGWPVLFHASDGGAGGAREEARLLTEDQAARRLAVSRYTLRNWRSQGGGPTYVQLGRAIRYRVSDLDAYVASRTREWTRG